MAHLDTSAIIRAAVWIRPSGKPLELVETAANTARRRGGGPVVRPHLTLIAGIETTQANAEHKLKRLATQLQPFKIRLTRIEWRNEYFRSFYATAELSAELSAAQRAAYDIFEMKPAPDFEPHVSLLYGNIDETLKRSLAAELGNKLNVEFDVPSLHLVNATTDVPVAEWHTIAEHPVTG